MKLLLDTHVLLWWLDDPSTLSNASRIAIANPRNPAFVSAASMLEIAIKQEQKRLSCPANLLPLLDVNNLLHLPITLYHAMALRLLPPLHKDPFDRMLLAQCRSEGMTLVTRDRLLTKYEIPVLLA